MKPIVFRFIQVIHNTFYPLFGIFIVIMLVGYSYFALPDKISTIDRTLPTAYLTFKTDKDFTINIDKRLKYCLKSGYIDNKCRFLSPVFSKIKDIYTQNLPKHKAKILKEKPYEYSEIIDDIFGYNCYFFRFDNYSTIECGEFGHIRGSNGMQYLKVIAQAETLIKDLKYKGFLNSLQLEFEAYGEKVALWCIYGFLFLVGLAVLEYILFGKFKIGFLRKRDIQKNILDYL
ncbi:hypothetical protein [Campylobacter sp. CN_NA1]|uniref:hypothetical protein n=1 Tax=Campylobacter sp. CN_NA1 TaxID=2984150 RepID=UPI0022E9E209|nr:hypothetical protein [Campylobacter sp. CN_NA1]MDA3056454.1 hypothetical protein [Campylobacter sp. CN_NA1]